MSMNHKAFLLDYQGFQTELKPTIQSALITGNCAAIRRFIAKHLSQLKDPCDGEPLGDDWEQLLETHDIHHYGDVALTRFYSPRLDLGVGDAWLEVDRYICIETGTSQPAQAMASTSPSDKQPPPNVPAKPPMPVRRAARAENIRQHCVRGPGLPG